MPDSLKTRSQLSSGREAERHRSGTSSWVLLFILSQCILFAFLTTSLFAQDSAAQPFLGRWDLTLTNGSGKLPSWIDVSEDNGQLKLVFVGVTDHATWMKEAAVKDGQLMWVSPANEEGFPADTTYSLKRVGGGLKGTVTNSQNQWSVVGERAPSFKDQAVTGWGRPIKLFNGKNLSGWRFKDPAKASTWKVVDGDLVKSGNGSEMMTTRKFRNFKLHVEFNAGPSSNSGVYLRGRYEVQIETNSASEPPSHHTGGVYGFLDPTPEQPRVADKWQSFDITLIGRTVTIVQNGITVIDHKEIPGITGGALDSNEGQPGPIYLQGSENGRVAFRNLVLTPAKN
ncbi:MAG: 3-keto-disaccharide hydrolase [Acidobacteriaceae bacterium]